MEGTIERLGASHGRSDILLILDWPLYALSSGGWEARDSCPQLVHLSMNFALRGFHMAASRRPHPFFLAPPPPPAGLKVRRGHAVSRYLNLMMCG